MDELVEAVRRFVDQDVKPAARRHDRDDSYPAELVEQMRSMGLFGLTIPDPYGGLGLSLTAYVAIVEELGRGWASVPGLLNSHLTVASLLDQHGTEDQKHHFLPAMARGEVRAALLLTEPDAGSDLRAITTRVEIRDGGATLSGRKTMITNGREARLYAVLARQGDDLAVYLLETGRPGITVGPDLEKLGFRGVETVEIFLDQVPIQNGDRVGGRGSGLGLVLDALELGRLSIAASAVGLAVAAYEDALHYARERHAFGKPITDFQAIQFHLVDMHTRIAASRALTVSAARARERGRADLETAVAKYHASETALFAATTAMRVLGGYGYLKEYSVERYFRDAPVFIVGEGTNEVLKTVIARRLLEGGGQRVE
ncbi:MAG TPA: acyl-CoA dehydrogenase family protein [Acidimicrobiales bacterium]